MKKYELVFLLVFAFCGANAQKYELHSPDQKLSASIDINMEITVRLQKGGEQVFRLAGLNLETVGEKNPFNNLLVKKNCTQVSQ